MGARLAIAASVLVVGCIYQASNWWEREFATLESSTVSPDGCMRVETLKPYWVLPSMFHASPDPDPAVRNGIGRPWDAAYFKRAYELSTGKLLGETVVFDPATAFNTTIWNASRIPGRRIVLANGFPMVDTDRCADEATLSRLASFYRQEQDDSVALQKQWEETRRGH
jgi:hypothetical protein